MLKRKIKRRKKRNCNTNTNTKSTTIVLNSNFNSCVCIFQIKRNTKMPAGLGLERVFWLEDEGENSYYKGVVKTVFVKLSHEWVTLKIHMRKTIQPPFLALQRTLSSLIGQNMTLYFCGQRINPEDANMLQYRSGSTFLAAPTTEDLGDRGGGGMLWQCTSCSASFVSKVILEEHVSHHPGHHGVENKFNTPSNWVSEV